MREAICRTALFTCCMLCVSNLSAQTYVQTNPTASQTVSQPSSTSLKFTGDGTYVFNGFNNYLFASQYGLSNLFGTTTTPPSTLCTAGCSVIADPLDPSTDVFPNQMPSGSMFYDMRRSNGPDAHIFQNIGGGNGTSFDWYSFSNWGNNKGSVGHQTFFIDDSYNAYDYGFGSDPYMNGEYGASEYLDYFTVHAPGIRNQRTLVAQVTGAGDINVDSTYENYIPLAYSASSEGVTLHRDYMNIGNGSQPYQTTVPYSGTMPTGAAAGATLLIPTSASNVDNLAVYGELLDTTTDVWTGDVTWSSRFPFDGGTIDVMTTSSTVPVSIQGSLLAGITIQGIVFSASTVGSGAQATTIQFLVGAPTPDSSAASVSGSAITVQLINSTSGTRTLNDVISLFGSGAVSTPTAGAILSILSPGSTGTAAAAATTCGGYACAIALYGAAVSSPNSQATSVSFVVSAPSPIVVGALMDLMGPQFNEVTAPTAIDGTHLGSGYYLVTAPLWFAHLATTMCANTSASPGSGMIGRSIELTDLDNNFTAPIAHYKTTQNVLCSPTTTSILMGTIGYGSFQVYGDSFYTHPALPAKIFHSAMVHQLYNYASNPYPLHGIYLTSDSLLVAPNDTFGAGDAIQQSVYPVQNIELHKGAYEFDSWAGTWNGVDEVFAGPGLANGVYWRLLDLNPNSTYAQFGGQQKAPALGIFNGAWNGLSWQYVPAASTYNANNCDGSYLLCVGSVPDGFDQTYYYLLRSGGAGLNIAIHLDSNTLDVNGNGTYAGSVTAGSLVAASFSGLGAIPTISMGSGSGAGATGTIGTSSNPLAGSITIITGSGTTASSVLATIAGLSSAQVQGCSLMPRNAAAAAATTTIFTGAPTVLYGQTIFTINAGASAVPTGTTLAWSYICM